MNLVADAPVATIVLLPGMDGTGKLFQHWIAAKPPGYELSALAYPAGEALAYAELAQRVRAALPRDRPYFLLAESFSGPLGLMLSAEVPPGLRGLILCCSFAKGPLPFPALFKPLVALFGFAAQPAVLARLGHRALFGRFAGSDTFNALSDALRGLRAPVLRSRLRAVLAVDATPLLARVTLPVLYLQAKDDRVVPPRALRHLRQFLPHMQVARIAAPHMLLQTAPAEAWRAVLPFVGNVPAVAAKQDRN